MVWVLLGPLGTYVAEALRLSPAQKGLLVAVPLLGGSLFRLLLGPLWADSLPRLWLVGLLLGVAGASFAVALPLASRWYPPEHQGLALGIAGAGNSGTVFAALFAPGLAAAFGWSNVFGLALVPLAVALAVYILCAKDSPNQPPPKTFLEYLAVLREGD